MTAAIGPPALSISFVSAQPLPSTHRCGIVWQLENQGAQPIELDESWLPHGQFRAAREAFIPPLVLPAGCAVLHSRQVEVVVVPGGLVENAFLILRAHYAGEMWRIFTRMKIEAALDGNVQPIVEAITASPIAADA